MRKLIETVLATVAVVAILAPAALATTVAESTGGAQIDDKAGNQVNLSFKAGIDDSTGVFGELQQTTHIAGAPDTSFHADVLCYSQSSDNTTGSFIAQIDKADDPSLVGK